MNNLDRYERHFAIMALLRMRLEREHLKHVQILHKIHDGKPCFKFVNVDTPELKVRIKDICNEESLMLIEETKTILIYSL